MLDQLQDALEAGGALQDNKATVAGNRLICRRKITLQTTPVRCGCSCNKISDDWLHRRREGFGWDNRNSEFSVYLMQQKGECPQTERRIQRTLKQPTRVFRSWSQLQDQYLHAILSNLLLLYLIFCLRAPQTLEWKMLDKIVLHLLHFWRH